MTEVLFSFCSIIILVSTYFVNVEAKISLNESEKAIDCYQLDCSREYSREVCGIREETSGFRIKLFENECKLLEFGCGVKSELAFGLINMEYCERAFLNRTFIKPHNNVELVIARRSHACQYDCSNVHLLEVCGISYDGSGFRILLFNNKCQLLKYNCKMNTQFHVTDQYICDGLRPFDRLKTMGPKHEENKDNVRIGSVETTTNVVDETLNLMTAGEEENQPYKEDTTSNAVVSTTKPDDINTAGTTTLYTENMTTNSDNGNTNDTTLNEEYSENPKDTTANTENITVDKEDKKSPVVTTALETAESTTADPYSKPIKNLVILHSSMLDYNGNINDTMDRFFAGTHVLDLPIRRVAVARKAMNESMRRMLMKIAGPNVVFKPWIVIPKKIKTDRDHEPTLASCYHKCPQKCPDTYAPVCGVPGVAAREPSLMFKNHCFMDVAQCKMRWEDKGPTAISSAYIESSFLMCLGDALNSLYRFLPVIRTLQHMGRLKKKGRFHYKMRNMKFFNHLMHGEPKLMG